MDVRGALRGRALHEADVNGVELEGVGASSQRVGKRRLIKKL
jgi:hypothetical protein